MNSAQLKLTNHHQKAHLYGCNVFPMTQLNFDKCLNLNNATHARTSGASKSLQLSLNSACNNSKLGLDLECELAFNRQWRTLPQHQFYCSSLSSPFLLP